MINLLNKNYKLKKKLYPFPYVVIENFLEENFYKDLSKNFPKLEDFKKKKSNVKRMDFDLSYGDEVYNELLINNLSYKKLHSLVYSKEFTNFFLNLFREEISKEYSQKNLFKNIFDLEIIDKPYEVKEIYHKKNLPKNKPQGIYSRVDLGIGLKGYGIKTGGGGIHVDNPQRIISMLFYLGGFNKIIGGEHRIWKKSNKDELQIHENISTKENLIVVSLQNNQAFHDVKPVEFIDGTRNAFYLAISCTNQIWKNLDPNNFNMKYCKNRVKQSLFRKITSKIFK